MDEITVGVVGIASLFVAILAGVNVAVALGLVGILGLGALAGFMGASSTLSTVFFATTASFHFSVIPMFLLMGYFAMKAGLGEDLFEAAVKWFGRLPGGLAIATTGASAAFGAAAGSSVGTAVLFTKLALPSMLKRGYDKSLASASIAISGTLSVLIPPSTLMVVYCILTDASIGRLLLAGIIPGLVFTLIIMVVTLVYALRNPEKAPRAPERFTWTERFWSIRLIGPLVVVIGTIVGGLFFGVFTPTEGGAIGAVVTFVMAVYRQRGLKGLDLGHILRETVQTTCMIFAIIISALIFSRFLAFSGLSDLIGSTLTGLDVNRWVVVLIVTVIFTVLGMIMDAPAMLAVTLPVIEPVMRKLGFDTIWFGVYVVVLAELGLITPPVGLNCFVVKGAAGSLLRLEDVFRGITPYVFASYVMLLLLCLFPGMALFLPNAMR
ncbi:TRAP transporter large permease [Alsobacter sp. SYSU M60028]|uniref:TRAP transporter large permease protein n=1 Tax=Alsobacter ponti TaxID=2962936 RepID=A0ABT1LBA3_9HYPH|nr:TRAP transporter large permease [Alsobacter ponti]MCP8938757.1 TRAP transporter large permease [Alsobacter ponti]